MKAILEFNLPEDDYMFNDARNGTAWHDVVRGILDRTRATLKYQDPPEEVAKVIANLRDDIFQELGDRGLRLDD